MNRLLVICWVLTFQAALSQPSQLLPVVQKGKWKLIDTAGTFILDTPYDFISLFDHAGTAIVRKNNVYGVIDQTGNEIIAAKHQHIKQLQYGVYALHEKSGWTIVKPKEGDQPILRQLKTLPEPLSENWLGFERDSLRWLINLPSTRLIPVPDSVSIRWVVGEHLLLQGTKLGTFYNPYGDILAQDSMYYQQEQNIMFLHTKHKNYVINDLGEVRFKNPVRSLHHNYDNTLTIVFNKYVQLFSLPELTIILEYPVADLTSYNNRYYYITNLNGTVNLLEKSTKKKMFPDKYTMLYEMADYFYAQDASGLLYLLTKTGHEFVKGAYSGLYTDGQFIYIAVNKLQGLISCKTGKEVLPPIYTRIQISNQYIKAFRPTVMVALKLDKEHRIIDRVYMENPYELNTIGPPSGQAITLDPRLKAQGWYVDSTEREDDLGNLYFSYKIGLKNKHDSILRKPDLKNLHYLSNDFAINYITKRTVKYVPGHETEFLFFQILLSTNGKSYMSPILVDYDSTDLKTKSFMRVSTVDNFCILTDTGSLIPLLYIQRGLGTNLVYCKDALVQKEKKSSELTLQVPNIYFRDSRFDVQKPYLGIDRNKEFVRFEKGKWNYLTPAGKPLLPEDLDFAHPFVGSKAIVNKRGKWGVIQGDSLIIPFQYDQIERVIKEQDTFFICKQNMPGYVVLDSVLNAAAGPTNCLSSNGEIAVIEENGKQFLMDKSFQKLGEEQSSFKAYDNGFYVYKVKKDYFIVSRTGEVLGQTKMKIKDFVFDTYGVYEKGSKLGLISLNGDTLLQANFIQFSRHGNLLVALKNDGGLLLDSNLKQLFSFTTGTLLVDENTDLFAYSNKNTTTVYSPSGKKIKAFKKLTPSHFLNGKLLVLGEQSLRIDVNTKQVDTLQEIKAIHPFMHGYVALELTSNNHLLFDSAWQLIFGIDSAVRKINHLGSHVFEIRTKKGGTCVYNFENNTRLSGIDAVKGAMEQKRLLVEKNNRFYYVDDSLMRISNYEYAAATPFTGNRAAVLDFDGWTLIDPENNLLSYPDFNELTVFSPFFSKAKNKAHVGVFGNSGEVIIPCNYEKLVFVNKHLVQTFLLGEVQYFRLNNGTTIH
jgi:hypothetical protein